MLGNLLGASKAVTGIGKVAAGQAIGQPLSDALTPKGVADFYQALQAQQAKERKPDLPEYRDPRSGAITPYAKLAMRMGWLDQDPGSFVDPIPNGIDFVQVAKCVEGYVVFLVVNGKPMMIEDGGMFPSDTLVTKLRMIGGE